MATNLAIDDRLLEEARKIGGSKNEARYGHRSSARVHLAPKAETDRGAVRQGRLGTEVRLQGAAVAQVNVLVDTSVWSLAFRRPAAHAGEETAELVELIREGRVAIIVAFARVLGFRLHEPR